MIPFGTYHMRDQLPVTVFAENEFAQFSSEFGWLFPAGNCMQSFPFTNTGSVDKLLSTKDSLQKENALQNPGTQGLMLSHCF